MSSAYSWSVHTTPTRLSKIEHRINSNEPELNAIFTQTFFTQAHEQVKKLNAYSEFPLCGAIVSVKDLFDVQGFTTKAGSTFMANDPAATVDAEPIKKLRDAGAVFIGHTNMTELAFSGLGLNPHYGTPKNALYSDAIPGGSTAGGAVSVAHGIADIAIGTDTGGSLRIPAAFNGIVGFKPSQRTVSRVGCKALSRSLDSVGPMARTVAECRVAYDTLSDIKQRCDKSLETELIIPSNYGMSDLQPEVEAAFSAACAKLVTHGFRIKEDSLNSLENLKNLPVWHFASVESRAEYDDAYTHHRKLMDPRIAGPTRMGRADEVDAVSYRKTLNQRQDLIEEFTRDMNNRILLLPTTPILPPNFDVFESDEEYARINLQVLRNPSIGNVMDGCSISIPYKHDGATIGVMLTATNGFDIELLALAEEIESLFT